MLHTLKFLKYSCSKQIVNSKLVLCGALTLSLLVFVVTHHRRPCDNRTPDLVNYFDSYLDNYIRIGAVDPTVP